jgi:hypothetical protein
MEISMKFFDFSFLDNLNENLFFLFKEKNLFVELF